jgi:hypothetical protein
VWDLNTQEDRVFLVDDWNATRNCSGLRFLAYGHFVGKPGWHCLSLQSYRVCPFGGGG